MTGESRRADGSPGPPGQGESLRVADRTLTSKTVPSPASCLRQPSSARVNVQQAVGQMTGPVTGRVPVLDPFLESGRQAGRRPTPRMDQVLPT